MKHNTELIIFNHEMPGKCNLCNEISNGCKGMDLLVFIHNAITHVSNTFIICPECILKLDDHEEKILIRQVDDLISRRLIRFGFTSIYLDTIAEKSYDIGRSHDGIEMSQTKNQGANTIQT